MGEHASPKLPPINAPSSYNTVSAAGSGDPFRRLVPFQWRGELLVICGCMLASFLIAGFWYPYWRIADMDFWIVYNGFLLNAGLPQEYFDHPGYLSIVTLAGWLHALHDLGILRIDSFVALPPVTDGAAFTQAWTAATRAGRVLSLIFALGFVTAFAYLMRLLVRDWRIAAFAAFLLAFSGGMAMQMRIMRTELLAAGLFYAALLALLIVARRGSNSWRPALIGLAALGMTLALENKIQIVFLICALPLIILPFGPVAAPAGAPPPSGFWATPRKAWPLLMAAIAAALLSTYLAKDTIAVGFSDENISAMRLPVLSIGAPFYWSAITAWLAAAMIAYAAIWRVSLLETLATCFAVVAGAMIGILFLQLRYNIQNVVIIFHPLEQMFLFAFGSTSELAGGASPISAARIRFLMNAVVGLIERRTFVLESSPRPTIFLEWFVIAATVFAWRKGERQVPLQVAALMVTAWAIDLLGMARGLKQEYFILTDPLVIIAAALLVAQVVALQYNRWTYGVGVALIIAHATISQAEPVKHIFRTDGPEVLCGLYHSAKRVAHLPVCAK